MRDDRHADAGSSHVGRPAAATARGFLPWSRSDFVERAAHAELARRLAARPIVAAIVGVVAVDDDGVALGGDARRDACRARACRSSSGWPDSRGIPARSSSPVWMISWRRPNLLRDVDGQPPMVFRVAGAVGGDGDRHDRRASAGDEREVGAVDAAAIRDDDRAERRERLAERALPSGEDSLLPALVVVFFLLVLVVVVVVGDRLPRPRRHRRRLRRRRRARDRVRAARDR